LLKKKHLFFLIFNTVLVFCFISDLYADSFQPLNIFKDCDNCPEMVEIPIGSFMMGTPLNSQEIDRRRGEGPQVKITISHKFAVGRFEITHDQFSEFVKATGYSVKSGCRVWERGKGFFHDPEASWLNRRQPVSVRPDHPVGCVSWKDSKAYVAWLSKITKNNYRLMSEAEWEYVARGGTSSSRFWGDDPNDSCQWANTFDLDSLKEYPFPWKSSLCTDGYEDLAPVGSFKPNPFGIYDILGNVWEWTEDCWVATHIGRPSDGSPWVWRQGCDMHAVRGGGWLSAPERNRVAWPGRDPTDRRNTQFGFRIARDL